MFDHAPPTPVDRPDCPHCATARAGQITGLTDAGCMGCVARELASTQQAFAACRLGRPGPLQALIRDRWPGRRSDGRRAVWDWCNTLGLARQNATNPLATTTTAIITTQ